MARLAKCHVLVHPSLHDTGGWVCLEAMASGRPVICLDLGGPATQVTDDTGFRVPATTPEQAIAGIAAAMRQLHDDPDLRRRMSQAGAKRVMDAFCWDEKVKRMDAIECACPFNQPQGLVHGIIVNRYGQRFVNEDTYQGRVGQTALLHHGGEAYLIVDEEHYTPNWLNIPATWVCETVAELEAEIGLPARSLVTTVGYYNEHAERGTDPLFHKRAPLLTPLRGPVAGFDLRASKFIYAPFTLGGLHTRSDGAVLGRNGEAIPGLFAAGRTTSGVAAQGYASGLSLGDSTFFGRLAGLSAAGVT